MRLPLIAGNWKMYKTAAEARATAATLRRLLADPGDVEVAVCPPFTALPAVAEALAGSGIAWGGQDLHWEKEGAFTGEVSGPMLRDLGCTYVIVGHSERRQYFGETDEVVARKIGAALAAGLTPIACVGETLAEREGGQALAVLERQGRAGLAPHLAPGRLVVAYEPVWAIGTGRTATPAQANEAHAFLRDLVRRLAGETGAASLRILYGGSVKAENIRALMDQPEIDGALVGGASLDPAGFARIARYGHA